MKKLALFTITLLSLTACKQETYTVDFLKENEQKRNEVLEACKQNKQSDENCNNANEAQTRIKSEEFKKSMFEKPNSK